MSDPVPVSAVIATGPAFLGNPDSGPDGCAALSNAEALNLLELALASAPTTEPVASGVLWRNNGVVTLSVGIPPAITSQPSNQSVTEGATATFSVTATNAATYQWQKQESGAGAWSNISGATASSYTTGTLTVASDNTDQYRCVVTGAGGTTTSDAATLTVSPNVVTLSSGIVSKMQGVFGTSLLVSGYSGPGVKLRRISDNTLQDFSFGSDGRLSKSAIDSFMGASQLRIEQWYDQSGLGNHLISSATSTQRPGFRFDNANNPVVTLSDFADMPVIAGPEYMECATGTFATRDLSVYQVGRWLNQSDTQNHAGPAQWQFGLSGSTDCISAQGAANVNTTAPTAARFIFQRVFINGSFVDTQSGGKSSAWANTSLGVATFRSTSSGIRWKHGNWFSRSLGAQASLTGRTGFRFGASFGTSFRSTAHATMFLCGAALSDVEEVEVETKATQIFNAVSAPARQVIVDGDSISAAYNGTLYDNRLFSWSDQVSRNLGTGVLLRNVAISSSHFDATADGGTRAYEITSQAPDRVDTLMNGTAFTGGQLIVIWAGTNDILYKSGVSGDGTAVHTRLQAYCNARKAATPSVKILVVGPIPRGPFSAGRTTELNAFNTLIAANWASYADGFVDMSAQNWTPSGSYATNYQSDQIHPNATGHAKAAAIIEPAIRTLLGM